MSVKSISMIGLVIFVGAILAIAVFGDKSLKGKVGNTAYSYSHPRMPFIVCCQTLTLCSSDTLFMFDRDNNNVIGNDPEDYLKITSGEEYVLYKYSSTTISTGWKKEVMLQDSAFAFATKTFQVWKDTIFALR